MAPKSVVKKTVGSYTDSTFGESDEIVFLPTKDNLLALQVAQQRCETQLAEDPASPRRAEECKNLNQLLYSLENSSCDSPGPLTEMNLAIHDRSHDLLPGTEAAMEMLFNEMNSDLEDDHQKEMKAHT